MFDHLIFKEDSIFYIDLTQNDTGVSLDVGDSIKFKYENVSYLGTIVEGNFSYENVHNILITKEVKNLH